MTDRASSPSTGVRLDPEDAAASHIALPFRRVSARALIVRRRDGALLGTKHRPDGQFALPGGTVEAGETPAGAIVRELDEENFELHGRDDEWRSRLHVTYYDAYCELSVWHVFVVDDVTIGPCDETITSRWISQEEEVWYPFMRDHIGLALEKWVPHLAEAA